MSEHGVLKRALLVYRAAGDSLIAGRPADRGAIHSCASVIHDYIEGFHEQIEEAHVFPPLMSGSLAPTVLTLFNQHGRGRQITAQILDIATNPARDADLVTAMAAFVRMYEPHEAREDTVIFPALRAAISDQQLADLAHTIAQQQTARFSADAFTDVVNRVAAAEQALGIADLATFTPPAPA
jgi:hemerythrin-like domain-containing protein